MDALLAAWLVIAGGDGPAKGKHVVLVAADEEYRSEEMLPQLAKILAKHHGFKCTVLFAIDAKDSTINPNQSDNIPGLEALQSADLMVLFTRFRKLPDEQMKHIVDYVESGKPVIGKQNDPMMPIAWTKSYTTASDKTARVFTSTMGSSQDFTSEGLRRLLVNACYWAVGLEERIAERSRVELVGSYEPSPFKGN